MNAAALVAASANLHHAWAAGWLDQISNPNWTSVRAHYDTDDAAIDHLARVGTLMDGWEGEDAHEFAHEAYVRALPDGGAR